MSLDMEQKMPRHVAIIPDGNRRWAKAHGQLPWIGHKVGVDRFQEVSEAAFQSGVEYVTFWAASSDNLLKRATIEVAFLLKLFKEAIEREFWHKQITKHNIRVRVLGKWRDITKDTALENSIGKLEDKTKDFAKRTLTILFGYDGQQEMIDAFHALKYSKEPVTIESLHRALWTKDLPPVDLVIRTGGEPHWSAGFMMWHTANSQFYFTEELWPDFTPEKLKLALADYAERGRRFGK